MFATQTTRKQLMRGPWTLVPRRDRSSALLTSRELERHDKTVGPREDPYSRVIYQMNEAWADGTYRIIKLVVCALEGCWIEINDRTVSRDVERWTVANGRAALVGTNHCSAEIERRTSLTIEQFMDACNGAHHRDWMAMRDVPCMACGRGGCSGRCCE